jgi:kumamolisin
LLAKWKYSCSVWVATMLAASGAVAANAIPAGLTEIKSPAGATLYAGQPNANGYRIARPQSNFAAPGQYRTHMQVLIPPGGYTLNPKPAGQPATGALGETPASIACIYRLVPVASGCNPNVVTTNVTGGSKAIGIVDAYNYASALSDLTTYSNFFGLPAPDLRVIYGTGNPANGCVNGPVPPTATSNSWDGEAALDIEMAHALAPNAIIYLVLANSPSNADMAIAVQVATACVQAAGGGEISMSFGTPEFAGETAVDIGFTAPNITFFASAGDAPGVEYPSASPNVFGVGGTTVVRDQNTGAFESEVVWSSTGGGPSAYESTPSYQNGLASLLGGARGVPDLAAIADPSTGVWIFNTPTFNGWTIIGGTSAAAPIVAGIVNRAGFFWSSSLAGLTNIYNLAAQSKLSKYVTDVNSGVCGPKGAANGAGGGYDPAWIETTYGTAWDWCTGWGSPHGSH